MGRDRGNAGEDCRLRFLAAKTTAHATHFDHHLVEIDAERMRDHLLHLGRMLGRAPQVETAVFFRCDVGDLSFQVKLFLPADRDLALLAPR